MTRLSPPETMEGRLAHMEEGSGEGVQPRAPGEAVGEAAGWPTPAATQSQSQPQRDRRAAAPRTGPPGPLQGCGLAARAQDTLLVSPAPRPLPSVWPSFSGSDVERALVFCWALAEP